MGETHRLHLPSIATFEFELARDEVRVRAGSRVSRATVVDQFYRTAVPLVLQARGWQVLHASAVRTAEGIVALCATKESGKSTLAGALERLGYPLWADDAVVFEAGETGIESCAVPFRLRLRPASAALLGGDERTGWSEADPAEWTLERVPLRAAVILQRSPAGSPIELERLGSGSALTAVLTHGYSFTLSDPERKAAMMRQYMALAATVPVFRFRYPTGLEHLDEMLERLKGMVLSTAFVSES